MSAISTTQNALRLRPGGISLSLKSWPTFIPLACVIGVALAINIPTFHDYFHGDDYLAFIDMVSKPAVKHMWEVLTFRDADVYWRPLGELYYLVIWKVFGLNEVAFHAANTAVFLVTLCLLYAFCLQAGLGRFVAATSAAFLALFPNHVVSVAWVTNGPRLLSIMFALAALVLLQKAIETRRLRYDILAIVAFGLGGMSDETVLALAPLPIAYSFLFDEEPGRLIGRRTLRRLLPYGALAGSLIPMQFLVDHDAGTLNLTKFGWHMPQHFWAITSKLVLPSTDGVDFAHMANEQWIAGAIGIAGLAMALLLGSRRLRFLALWTCLGILPFTIWVLPIAPARYVYMAAVPFAVIAGWALASLYHWLALKAARLALTPTLSAAHLVGGGFIVLVVFLASVGLSISRDRDQAFAKDTEQYRLLADGLKAAAPQVPRGSRIVIYYGIWTELRFWPDAVAKTIYRDRSVRIVNVPRGEVETGGPGRDSKDIILFYTGKGFIKAAPQRSAVTPAP